MAARAFALEAVGQYRVVVHYPGDPRGPSVNGDLADRVDIALAVRSPRGTSGSGVDGADAGGA